MRERRKSLAQLSDDPLWYKDAVIYEVHVRAFQDSSKDGSGDFRGLTKRLDYIKDLGVTAIWVLPFYPSPLRDDGYDIADYYGVHESFGTKKDVVNFINEAHSRGIRVITELVCNHTSDQHPWFQRARRAKPGSAHRDFYVWSDTEDRYKDARIIFQDFERSNWTWDAEAGAYYWHRFYSHQPDLNYDSPLVRKEIFKVLDHWLGLGVDGLRLDAVPYIFEREGTNCENLPETHDFLRDLRAHVEENFPNRMLLSEANQWPDHAAAYFGENDDECHMAFHFPLMPRLFMATRMEDRFPIINILDQTPAIGPKSQWALFLRNHDELTLEMVTDEERDYMYRFYAYDPQMRVNLGIRRRLAPLLQNNRRLIELLNMLLFSLPGTPVIYYGDEIGMGDNIYLGDRNGVRTPMQWSNDRNAGFSEANRQQLYLPLVTEPEYHYESVNVRAQQANPNSLLWWMKRVIAMRKKYQAFGRGGIDFLHPHNRKVLAFIRCFENENILVVANLSQYAQVADLNLSQFRGSVPVEMFGRTEFPPITDQPYFITLGPHSFYWFSIEPQKVDQVPTAAGGDSYEFPVVQVVESWTEALDPRSTQLSKVLPGFVATRRWFGSKSRPIRDIAVRDAVPVPYGSDQAFVTLLTLDYSQGEPETYVLPLTYASGERAGRIVEQSPAAVIARVRSGGGEEGLIYDATYDPAFGRGLPELIGRRRRLRGAHGELVAAPTRQFRGVVGGSGPVDPVLMRAEQSNSSLRYGNFAILKVFRRVESGPNLDLEMGQALVEAGFQHTPSIAGSLEYRTDSERFCVAVLQDYVENEGDAWQFTLDALGPYFERAQAQDERQDQLLAPPKSLLALTQIEVPRDARELIGPYLESARLLARRTAEMHLKLASIDQRDDFAPEAMSSHYQQALFHSLVSHARGTLRLLRQSLDKLLPAARAEAEWLIDHEQEIVDRFRVIRDNRIVAQRIRCHGDFHLGQVLSTGNDFVIIDFEGEPARPLSERWIKRPPLRDVTAMIRSFHYAAYSALTMPAHGTTQPPEEYAAREPWARSWYQWVARSYLKLYLSVASEGDFLPKTREELSALIDAFLLEKCLYEITYEINNRPTWTYIPLVGLRQLLEVRG